jgi:outer membrane lipoprotein-sorting protein
MINKKSGLVWLYEKSKFYESLSRFIIVFVISLTLMVITVSNLAADEKESQEIITNETIIELVKSGLSDNAIISLIKRSKKKFDMSPQSLIKLKQAGVSNAVIEEMLGEDKESFKTKETLPTTYGFYVIDENQIYELKPTSVTTKVGLQLLIGDKGMAVDGLYGKPSIKLKNQQLSFIVYQQNIIIDTIHLSPLVYIKSMQAYEFNILNTNPNFFRNVYKQSYYDVIPIDLWRPENDLQLRIEPISDKPDMYRLIPSSPLKNGMYAIYIGNALHKRDMIFTAFPNRYTEAFYFRIEDTTGKEIFEKVIKAIGDPEKIKNIKNISYKFDFTQITPEGEMKMEGEIVTEFPDKIKYSILTPGNQFSMIVNGKKGWLKSQGKKIKRMPKEQRESFIRGIKRDPFYIIQNFDQYEIQLKREKNIDSTKDITLLITGPTKLQILIDPKTNLPIAAKYQEMIQAGSAEVEEVFSFYKKVDGINIPFNIVGKSNDKKNLEINIKEMKFNIEIEKDFFKGK